MSRSPNRINKLVAECLAIEAESAKEAGMLAFMARAMVMATLPHRKPIGNTFQRKNGDYILTMMANPEFGLPYGSLPRLLLAWMTREAKRTGSPILHLGKTFSEFLRTLKLSRSGGKRGDATRLREQMLRLFTTHISCVYQNKKEGVCKSDQFLVTRSFELWWNPLNENQRNISQTSTITLAKDFFDELIDRPVPVDFRVLQALRRSPLQIDIYVWLTYRFSYLKRPTLIPWNLLINQFGSDYAVDAQGLRGFKKQFLKALHIVTMIYTDAKVEVQDDGVILKPSKSHIKSNKKGGDLVC
ncbi:MAG TPA: replication protein RepA [Candidatus Babeliales bacterium]|nr:replication protein RepA [Candidatus Babeliales bacterium]